MQRQLPTINGTITVCDAVTGQIKFLLNSPEVTGRGTAAVTLLAIRTLLKREPKQTLLFEPAHRHVITYKLSIPFTHSASCGATTQCGDVEIRPRDQLHEFSGRDDQGNAEGTGHVRSAIHL